jgi:uncharacterized protein YaiL (DUF2058 family)
MAKLSLQEQLLKSGLVSAAKAKSVKAEKRKQTQQQRKNGVELVDEAKELAQKAQAEKIERDRELNQIRQQQEEQKQLAAQIKQIIELNRLPRDEDGMAYNFTDDNKVKRLHVSVAMRDQIAEGRLAIVKLGGGYEVVSAEAAGKIQQRDADSVIVFNRQNQPADAVDDVYAAYQVPDDLIW